MSEIDFGEARVLIVDDEKDSRDLVRVAFEEIGVKGDHIDEAGSVDEAVDRIDQISNQVPNTYDAYVLNIRLGEGSGFTIARLLREERGMVVSGKTLVVSGESSLADEAEKLGLTFIPKPFEILELQSHASLILSRSVAK